MKLISRLTGIHPVAGHMGSWSRCDVVVIGIADSRNTAGVLVWLAG
jgi:hypothetical protein